MLRGKYKLTTEKNKEKAIPVRHGHPGGQRTRREANVNELFICLIVPNFIANG